jgi:hypothetical protein
MTLPANCETVQCRNEIVDDQRHPGRMDEELKHMSALATSLLQHRTWSPASTVLVSWLDRLQVLATQIAALQASVAAELSGRGWAAEQGATNARAWTRDHLKVSNHSAKRLCELGALLDARPRIRDAVASGSVSIDQAASPNNSVPAPWTPVKSSAPQPYDG